MNLINFLLSQIYTVYIGYIILRYIIKSDSKYGLFVLPVSYFLGIGIISFQMLLYSVLGVRWNAFVIIIPWLIFLPKHFTDLLRTIISKKHLRINKTGNILIYFLLFASIVQISLIYSRFFIHKNAIGWDAVNVWYYKAKVFYTDQKIKYSIFSNPILYQEGLTDTFIRSSYPISLPLYLAFIFINIGGFSIFWGNLLWLIMFSMLLAILYGYFRCNNKLTPSLFFLFMFLSIPANFDHLAGIYAGYAELPLLCFITSSVIFYLNWLKEKIYLIFI